MINLEMPKLYKKKKLKLNYLARIIKDQSQLMIIF